MASTRVPLEAASRLRQPSLPGNSPLRPPPRLLPQRPQPASPPGLRLGHTHTHPPGRPPTHPPRFRFPPLVCGPRRHAHAQRRPTEGRPATGRRAGSALHFLVGRLDARSRQPPRRRSENARASLRAPPPGSIKGGACWGVPSLHDDRRPLRGCWPLYLKRFTALRTRRRLSWQEVRA